MARLFEHDERRVQERGKRLEEEGHYRSPNPATPIPRRASASSPGSVKVRSRYSITEFQEADITRLPTVPPSAIWQSEVLEYSPFLPSSPSIDELDTLPPIGESVYDEPSYIDAVVEADTVMDDTLIIVPSLPSDIDRYPTLVEDAVDVALTVRARELLSRNRLQEDRPAFIHNPLDYVRWWLLGSGHLEFLFWLGGAVLLGVVMCVLLVMTGLGLGWMSFGHLGH